MHTHDLSPFQHQHDFVNDFSAAERNTRRVMGLTAVMMIAEIIAGLKFHSMALYADGWHMGTHVIAFFISAWAYSFARKHAANSQFSFGTGKIGVLGAYTSAIILGGVALFMLTESVERLFHPLPIHFNEAIGIAILGLLVNVASTFLLKEHGHSHDHDHHDHSHSHGHGHHDLNLKAAYIHVIADAVTSLLAIAALIIGKFSGWTWLDPVIGIAGSAVIAQWAYSLIRQTNIILLDREPDSSDLNLEIRNALEKDETKIADLHIWQVGVNKFAAIISLVTHHPQAPLFYKERLKEHEELVHVTVEVNECTVP